MKEFRKIGIILALLLIVIVGQKVDAVESTKLDNEKNVAEFVDKEMTRNVEKFHIPGAVISVVKDEKLIYSNGYGMANIKEKQKADANNSMFRIASTTKLFTWTAVMQLVEQGKIDLDTDINTYLKEVKIPDTFKKSITMRDLMTHTAGFEEGGVGYQITTDEKKLNETISDTLKKHPLARIRPAGETASYSNYGATLAGLIVEDVSGMSYEDYIQKNIFDVLNMTHATVVEPLPDKYLSNQVIGYNYENKQFVPGIPTYEGGFSPAGAGTVSANDMAKFMLAHLNKGSLNNKQILKKQTTDLMHQTAFRFDKRLPGSTLGFQEGEINGQKTISHAGADVTFITDLILVPEQKVGIFLSFSGGQADEALGSMKSEFFNHFYPLDIKKEPQFIKTSEEELANYTGSYKFTRRNISHIDKFFSLLTEMTVSQEEGQLTIGQGKEQEFFKKIAPNLFQQVGGQQKLVFKTDKTGKATSMLLDFMPDMPLEKTKFWDQSKVWLTLLGIATVIFIVTILTMLVRVRKFKTASKYSKRLYGLLAATASVSLLTLVLTVTQVLNMDALKRLSEITLSLKLFLILPIVVVMLCISLLVKSAFIWYRQEYSFVYRILITFVVAASIILSTFFFYWNLLGWQFG
ncbi:serine hydrolase domain-containing protein [Vagococcus sp.]|uniref:serine hydrolase domain-containing protein n=1 Tax=Vagococcus sp. TaxID=1933889 RepID=UPI002FCC47BA